MPDTTESYTLRLSPLQRLLPVAQRCAVVDRSDPFVFNRIVSHHLNGVKSIADYADEYKVKI